MAKRSRRIAQLAAAALYNANIRGFATGKLYRGTFKNVCVPGLNCYSCPGAVASCPLGALQAGLGKLPRAVPYYALGLIILFGALLGRAVCSFLCPFGLIQELLYKIPSKKLGKSRLTRALSYGKYVVLAVFVAGVPLLTGFFGAASVPGFCKWVCPAGTLEGGLPAIALNEALRALVGARFWWKIMLLGALMILSVFLFRPFCRFLCPLGALYGFFNRVAVLGIRRDDAKCDRCGACARACKLDVKIVNDHECVRCGECARVCPRKAIDDKMLPIKGRKKT